jgi:hypothetical protein
VPNPKREERSFSGVTAADASAICRSRSGQNDRLLEFIRSLEASAEAEHRQVMVARGARECLACGATFVPVTNKTWTQAGFCSKICHIERQNSPSDSEDADA